MSMLMIAGRAAGGAGGPGLAAGPARPRHPGRPSTRCVDRDGRRAGAGPRPTPAWPRPWTPRRPTAIEAVPHPGHRRDLAREGDGDQAEHPPGRRGPEGQHHRLDDYAGRPSRGPAEIATMVGHRAGLPRRAADHRQRLRLSGPHAARGRLRPHRGQRRPGHGPEAGRGLGPRLFRGRGPDRLAGHPVHRRWPQPVPRCYVSGCVDFIYGGRGGVRPLRDPLAHPAGQGLPRLHRRARHRPAPALRPGLPGLPPDPRRRHARATPWPWAGPGGTP
jgi:hypothetical protein